MVRFTYWWVAASTASSGVLWLTLAAESGQERACASRATLDAKIMPRSAESAERLASDRRGARGSVGPPDRAICICSLRPDWKNDGFISAPIR